MRDPNFFCLCPVFVVNPVVLMDKVQEFYLRSAYRTAPGRSAARE